jgi:hypothetical protein
MISANHFIDMLVERDLLPDPLVESLRKQLEESPMPISAALVAKRLVDTGFLSRLLAQRLLDKAENLPERPLDPAKTDLGVVPRRSAGGNRSGRLDALIEPVNGPIPDRTPKPTPVRADSTPIVQPKRATPEEPIRVPPEEPEEIGLVEDGEKEDFWRNKVQLVPPDEIEVQAADPGAAEGPPVVPPEDVEEVPPVGHPSRAVRPAVVSRPGPAATVNSPGKNSGSVAKKAPSSRGSTGRGAADEQSKGRTAAAKSGKPAAAEPGNSPPATRGRGPDAGK